MARTKGSFNNPNSFEVTVSAPLDARQRVDTDADLINANTWITGGMDYSFEGMLVYSQQSKAYWFLTSMPATNVNNWKQISAGSTGDPSETYATTATLSTAINGITTISASTTTKSISDFFAYRTLVNDKDGTVAVVDSIVGNDIKVRTVTTSGALRQGVRIGAVADETLLPATVADAEAAGFVTPVGGDYMNVRKDSTHDNKLAVYLITNIDGSGNITWMFDHIINDGDYQEQSTTAMTGKILTGGTTQGSFGTPIDQAEFVKGVKLNGTALTKDATGAVDVTAPVQSITMDGTPQVPDNAGNVALSSGVKTVSINGVNIPKDHNSNVDLPAFVKTISVNGVNVPQDDSGNVDIIGGGGGSAELTEKITSNVAVGAAPANTEFNKGLSFTEFAKKILISELAPSANFSATNSGLKEIGTSASCTMTLTITSTGTAKEIVSVKFYVGSTMESEQAYSGSNTFTYAHPTAITSNTTVKAVVSYKKSDGSNAVLPDKTASYTFVNASYYGIVGPTGNVTADMVKGLTKDIRSSRGKTVNGITTNFQRIVFAYPASFGNLTSIKDGNGFSNFESYERQSLTIDSVNYNVYVLKTPMTTTNATQIYA